MAGIVGQRISLLTMQLRSATIDDAETVASILIASRHEYLPYAKSPHSSEEIRRWVIDRLIPSGGVVVADLEDHIIGVMATSVSEGVAWIDQLYIKPGYVGRRFGTELLNHAKILLPRPIRLWTFQENYGAIRFYERHGFKAVERTTGEKNEENCPDVLYEYS